MPQAAWQVKNWIFLVKIKFFPIYANIFVMQGKCLFQEISTAVIPLKNKMNQSNECPLLSTGQTQEDMNLSRYI